MMKRNALIALVVIVILVIWGIIYFGQGNNYSESTKEVEELWDMYDFSVSEIESILDEIIDYSDSTTVCGNLKNVTIENESYIQALNSLACYINLYYYDLIQYDEQYHNYIIDYREKEYVTKEEINNLIAKLKNDVTFYDRLNKFNLIYYGESDEINVLEDKVNTFLNSFDLDFYEKEDLTYKEILVHKISEISYVAYLANWIKSEYYLYVY